MSIRLSTTIMYNSCRSMKRHSAVFTHCKIPSIAGRYFQTRSEEESRRAVNSQRPGSVAFADCETDAISDLFYHFAKTHGGVDDRGTYLTNNGVREILKSIGERSDDEILGKLMHVADGDRDGKLYLQEFWTASDKVLSGSPARIVLVVGGPGSGKGHLCSRLAKECGVVHLSGGELLRNEIARGTPLGFACAEIMKRGELVSSAVITALVRRHMRSFPGRRVLLDGFPRSLQNAHDFVELCGKPELALHLDCDDTILLERIMKRKNQNETGGQQRADDDINIALKRLRTFHKYHKPTIDWLREIHVPVVNLDCTGTPENVWEQLLAIGRLMRPVAQFRENIVKSENEEDKSFLASISESTA